MPSLIKNFWKLLSSKNKKKGIVILFFTIFGAILEMIGIGLVYPIVSYILSNQSVIDDFLNINLNIYSIDKKSLTIYIFLFFLFFYIVKNFFLVCLTYYQNKYFALVRHEISNVIFQKYLYSDMSLFIKKNPSEITRNLIKIINDLNTLVFIPLIILLSEIFVVLFLIILSLYINFILTGIIFIALGLLTLLMILTLKNRMNTYGFNLQNCEQSRIKIINEMISGIREIKLLQKEHYFYDKYSSFDKQVANFASKNGFITQSIKFVLELAIIAILVFIVFFITKNGKIEELIPILSFYGILALRMVPSLNRAMVSVQQLKFSEKIITVIIDIFKFDTLVKKNKKHKNVNFYKAIILKNIFFKYENSHKSVFQNLNLVIKKNECIGIFGPSGSGKSTLINLIIGLLKPNSGNITIDSNLIKKPEFFLQNIVGYVPQDVCLLDESILKNIAFGLKDEEIDFDKAILCSKNAQAYDFISQLNDKFDTYVGDRGVKLSGGQKQRIAIARALYFGAEILVFDEATSALDNKTEKVLIQSIQKIKNNLTIIMVAHRLSTLSFCDKLYELNNGNLKLKN
ncbi:MAG: ABC transporter ATP-binding protein [Methylophilaceae bacterium]